MGKWKIHITGDFTNSEQLYLNKSIIGVPKNTNGTTSGNVMIAGHDYNQRAFRVSINETNVGKITEKFNTMPSPIYNAFRHHQNLGINTNFSYIGLDDEHGTTSFGSFVS